MRKSLLFLLCFPYATLAIGQNVMGRIISNGIGVPNVMVSDGQVVTVTDENGKYETLSLCVLLYSSGLHTRAEE